MNRYGSCVCGCPKYVRASHGQVNDSKQSSSDLTGKFLVFCKSGCSREVHGSLRLVVALGRFDCTKLIDLKSPARHVSLAVELIGIIIS